MKKVILMGALVLGFLMAQNMMAQKKDGVKVNAAKQVEAVAEPTTADSVSIDSVDSDATISAAKYDLEMQKLDLEKYKLSERSDIIQDVFVNTLLPISICVVLPLIIVFIIFYFKHKRDKERSELLFRMMDKDQDISAYIAAEKAPKELKSRAGQIWIWGLILTFLGIFAFILKL